MRLDLRIGLAAAARVLVVAAIASGATTAWASDLTPTSQLREANAMTRTVTTGYQCFDPIPALGCPVPLGDVSVADVDTAPPPILSAFVTTASVASGQAAAIHDSIVGVDGILASGSAASHGAMSEGSDPCCFITLIGSTRSTRDDVDVTFTLAEPTPYTFEASGHVLYPDPSFPVWWDAALAITLTGPGGEIASLTALPDFGCTSDPETYECTVAPAPLSISGVLAPGTYTLDVTLETMGAGSWLPSTGPLSGFASGAYDVALTLDAQPAVPVGGAPGAALLVAMLAWLGALTSVGTRIGPSRRSMS